MQYLNYYQPFIQFNQDYFLLYYLPTSKGKHNNEKSKFNLKNKENYSNGQLSDNTRRKIKSKLSAYFTAISDMPKSLIKKHEIQHTIITLTLPSTQVHSDNTIKRECLGRFIERAVYRYGIKFYYWVAEKQHNNNIHFHILTDKYIEWQWIRDTWNERLEKLNYISEFENKHGHRSPNSTDIEMIRNISNTSKYVAKYTTKIDQQGKIIGRLHGESDLLNKIGKFKHEFDSDFSIAVQQGLDLGFVNRLDLDAITLFKCDTRNFLKQHSKPLYEKWNEHNKSIFNSFYERV